MGNGKIPSDITRTRKGDRRKEIMGEDEPRCGFISPQDSDRYRIHLFIASEAAKDFCGIIGWPANTGSIFRDGTTTWEAKSEIR